MAKPLERCSGFIMLSPPPSESEEVDPWERPTAEVLSGVSALLAERGLSIDIEALRLELEGSAGGPADLSVPLHRVARQAGRDPAELAGELTKAWPTRGSTLNASAKGAYLNFDAEPNQLAATTLLLIGLRGEKYGFLRPTATSVCVEHTSANPNGPFHIGRVRNAIIGDTYARILRAAGHPVTVHYYVDDVGRQAAVISWIWSKPRAEWPPAALATLPTGSDGPALNEKPDHYYGRPYPAVSALLKEDASLAADLGSYAKQVEEGRAPPLHRELSAKVLDGMLASLARLGIRYDELVWESRFLGDGSVDKMIARLKAAPHAVQEENGAWAIDATGYGLPQESSRLIFTRADGTSLYATRDLAYHESKFAAFPRVIDVLGADHLLHSRVLSALLTEIGEPRRPEFVFYQYIQAPGGSKMSTRAGTAVYLDDLLDEAVSRAHTEVLARREDLDDAAVDQIAEAVGASAVRYSILRVAPDKPVQFRWEEALSFEGRTAPFLLYSYARATTLLRKAGRLEPPYPSEAGQLVAPEERRLVRTLSRLPGVVRYAARTGHVHSLATYAHELADAFHSCYQAVPVLRAGAERESRIALVAATRTTLGTTLDLLGLARPERM
ncbi:MAG: arginine--tRNA ligase [Thermoplasmata archaeon]|nr:arginine--tRNA ligase [Thermoplasmata archaeon]